jgi:hypothetical protein
MLASLKRELRLLHDRATSFRRATADAAKFRSDVNTDGNVNSGDAIAVRSRSGNSLP